jgi:hypothetical protein
MTLLQAYFAADFVALAADMRITRGGRVENDFRSKSMLWTDRALIAFTGLAELGRERKYTLQWYGELLASRPGFDTEDLVTALPPVLRATPYRDKRLTFTSVGYDNDGQPFGWAVTNAWQAGKPLPAARSEFRTTVLRAGPSYGAFQLGVSMPPAVRRDWGERLDRVHADGRRPTRETVTNILAGANYASAGPLVSKTCIVTTLTKDGESEFDTVTPKAKPGQPVLLQSPYMVIPGYGPVLGIFGLGPIARFRGPKGGGAARRRRQSSEPPVVRRIERHGDQGGEENQGES